MPTSVEKIETGFLSSMTVSEKVRLLESVWDSLCSTPGDVRSPEWHRQVLKDRKHRLETGQASRNSWLDAKDRLLELGR